MDPHRRRLPGGRSSRRPTHRDLVEQVRAGRADARATSGSSTTTRIAELTRRRRRDHRRRGRTPAAPLTSLDDLASIIYTSGTTGRPEGLRADPRATSSTRSASCMAAMAEFFNETTSTLLFLPIAHVFGRVDRDRRDRRRAARSGTRPTSRTWSRTSAASSRPSCSACRACSRRSTTAPGSSAIAGGKVQDLRRAPSAPPSPTRGPSIGRLGAAAAASCGTRVFDHLVYSQAAGRAGRSLRRRRVGRRAARRSARPLLPRRSA